MITWFHFFSPLLRVEKRWGTIYGFQTWSRLLTSIKFLPDRFGTMGSPASPKRRGSPLRKQKKRNRSSHFFVDDMRPFLWFVSCGFVWEDFRKVDGFSVFDLPVAQGDLPGILRFRSCQFFCFLQFSELEWILLTSRFDQGLIEYNQRNDFESLILILCSSHCFATSERIDSHTHTQISWSMALAVSSASKPGGQSIFHSFVATGFFLTFRKVQGYVRDPFESSV